MTESSLSGAVLSENAVQACTTEEARVGHGCVWNEEAVALSTGMTSAASTKVEMTLMVAYTACHVAQLMHSRDMGMIVVASDRTASVSSLT